MKRAYKISAWVLGGSVLTIAIIVGYALLKDVINPDFKETKIYPDENRVAPADTTIHINGIEIKMIGVKGG